MIPIIEPSPQALPPLPTLAEQLDLSIERCAALVEQYQGRVGDALFAHLHVLLGLQQDYFDLKEPSDD